MKMLCLALPVRLLGAILVGLSCSVAAQAASSATTKPAETAISPDRSLKTGMASDEIIKLIGRPKEITPVKVTEGQAEIWIYRRQIAREIRYTPTHGQNTPAFVGVSSDGAPIIGSYSANVYYNEYITTYQVTSLLMFDGKLHVAKQSLEQSRSYN